MADKNRTFAAPAKSSNTKRPTSSVNIRKPPCAGTVKDKAVFPTKVNKNTKITTDGDVTKRHHLPDLDFEYREIAYGKFLLAMLEDCLVDEKIAREETDMDIQMAQLADRFKNTVEQLDKTNRRLKDIKFIVEQKRLLDLKTTECTNYCETTDKSNVCDLVKNLTATEQTCLDKLETKNIDFGYSKESGHKQLLDAVTEAIDGLDQIKRHSNLDQQKFDEYSKSEVYLKNLEKDRFDLESLKAEFEAKFPKFSEKLLKEASEKIALIMKSDDEADDDGEEEKDD